MAISLVATAPRQPTFGAWLQTHRTRPRGPVGTAAVMLPALLLLIALAVLLACVALPGLAARRWLHLG